MNSLHFHRGFNRFVSLLTLFLFLPSTVQAWDLTPRQFSATHANGVRQEKAEAAGLNPLTAEQLRDLESGTSGELELLSPEKFQALERQKLAAALPNLAETAATPPVSASSTIGRGLPRLLPAAGMELLSAAGASPWGTAAASRSLPRLSLPKPLQIAALKTEDQDSQPVQVLTQEELSVLKAGQVSEASSRLIEAQEALDSGNLVDAALLCLDVQDRFTRTPECVTANQMLTRLEQIAGRGEVSEAQMREFESRLPDFSSLRSAESKYTLLTFLHHLKAFGADQAGRPEEAAAYFRMVRDNAWQLMNEHPQHPIQINVLTLYFESLIKLGGQELSLGMRDLLERVSSTPPDMTNLAGRHILGHYLNYYQSDPGMAWLQFKDLQVEAKLGHVREALNDPGVYPWIKAFIGYANATALFSTGEFELARQEYQRVVDTYPRGEATELSGYGAAFCTYMLAAAEPKVSLQAFSDFVQRFPDSEFVDMALVQMGKIYFVNKDYYNALDLYQQVVQTYPDSERAHGARQNIEYILTHFPEFFAQAEKPSPSGEEAVRVAQLCGPLALEGLLTAKGIACTVEELAELSDADESGTSMLALAQAAEAKGVQLIGVAANALEELKAPFIAYVNHDHFVLVTDYDATQVRVSDIGAPAISVSLQQFMHAWQGYALVETGTIQVAEEALGLEQLIGARGGSLTPIFPNEFYPECKNHHPPCDPKCPCDCPPPGGSGGPGNSGPDSCQPPPDGGDDCGGSAPPPTPQDPDRPDDGIQCIAPPCGADGGDEQCQIDPPGPWGPGGPMSTNPRGLARLNQVTGPGVNARFNTTMGALQIKETDLSVSTVGGMRFSFFRMFHNIKGHSNGNWLDAPYHANIGRHWAHSFSMKLHTSTNTDSSLPSNPPVGVMYFDQNGAGYAYDYDSTSGGYDHYVRTGPYYGAGENAVTLRRNTSTGKFYLNFPSGLEYGFSAAASSTYAYVCYIEYIQDIVGNQVDFLYDGAVGVGRLTKITLPSGDSRYFEFTYSGSGTSITKASLKLSSTVLQEMSYAYGPNNSLTKVTDRNSKFVTYRYDYQTNGTFTGTAIDQITDKAGNVTNLTWTYTTNSSNYWSATTVAIDGPTGLRTTFARNGDTDVSTVTNSSGGTNYSKYVYTPDALTGWYIASLDYYHTPGGGTADSWDYEYAQGRYLTKIIAPDGSTFAEYTYNQYGRKELARISKPTAAQWQYDASGLYPTRRVDPDGLTTDFHYDASWRLTKLVKPGSGANGSQFEYDSRGHITKVTDPLGYYWRYGFDAWGRSTSITNPLSQTTYVHHDNYSNVTKVRDARGNDTNLFYSLDGCGGCGGSAGLLTKIANAASNETLRAYDSIGRLTKTTDALSREVAYSYDAYGRMTRVTAPAGGSTYITTSYNVLGQVQSSTDFEGHTTSYAYDHLGRATTVTHGGADIKSLFSSLGMLTKVTDAANHVTLYEYDGLRRLTKLTDAIGKVTRYEYDGMSRATKTGAGATGTVDPTEYFFSPTTGMLTQVKYTAGGSNHSAYYYYDVAKRLTKLTDWLSGGTSNGGLSYAYDNAGRLTKLTDYDSSTLDYTYDAGGNVLTMNDYHSNSTAYGYNALNQLTKMTAPGSKVWDFFYNAIGQPTQENVPNGMASFYSYDNRNRMTKIDHKDAVTGGSTVLSFLYGLDKNGGITRIDENDGGYWVYGYDSRDRLTKGDYTSDWGHLAKYRYTYDAGDNMVSKQEPFQEDFSDANATGWTTAGSWSYTSGYARNNTPNAAYLRVARTQADAETRFSYYSENTSSTSYYLSVTVRDASSLASKLELLFYPHRAQIRETVGGTATVLADSTTATTSQGTWYDVVAKVSGSNITVYRAPRGSALQQILISTAATTTATTLSQFYIAAGAQFRLDDIKIVDGDKLSTWAMTNNNANELTQMANSAQGSTLTFQYDAWGRTTKKTLGGKNATYAYRYGSKLHVVTSDHFDEGNVTYEYGGDQKRRSRSAASDYTWYNWDIGWNTISEENSGGTLTQTYVHNPRRGGRATYAQIAGSSPSAGAVSYFVHDHLGSTRALYDASKVLIQELGYTPYGEAASTATPGTTHLFTGHQWDRASGLYFAPFRHYSPASARWTTRDPLGMVDGLNVYAYVRNSPLRATDLLGLCKTPCEAELRALNDSIQDLVDQMHIQAGACAAIIPACAACASILGCIACVIAIGACAAATKRTSTLSGRVDRNRKAYEKCLRDAAPSDSPVPPPPPPPSDDEIWA